ncbi:ATP-binding cassette domain-containing protein [Streptomyces sp. NPDC003717]|uniref:ATP-binding cassette domain-containing protein n=1 Tax=Streptomyces sp. NPDC003717 TaxID=3154276 RepID=UPI0033BCFE16
MTLVLDRCTYRYRRGRTPVLRDFHYALPDGLTVLLGPNGAGKSTLLRLAASVTRPQRGSVHLDGVPAGSRTYRQDVAWMPQDITPMPGLTAREYVAYIGWLKGMTRPDAWKRARQALAKVDLADRMNERSDRLSGGQLRRVGVAGALVHGARVLLLDEPTAGLDPYQRRVFRDLLAGLTGDIRVLLSTHDVADLAEEADHVSVLYDGRILHHGDTRSFLSFTPPGTVEGRAAEAAYTSLLRDSGKTL